MKFLILILILVFSSMALADSLVDQAYQRETTFLKAQKESLLKLKTELGSQLTQNKRKASSEIEGKQMQLSKLQVEIQTLQEEMKEIDKTLKEGTQSTAQLEKNYMKIRDILSPIEAKLGLASQVNDDQNPITRFESGLADAFGIIQNLSQEEWKDQAFLDQDEHLVKGQVFHAGLFAAWAKVKNQIYPLEPYNQDFLKMSPRALELDKISAYVFSPAFEKSNLKTYKTWKESVADTIPGIVMGIIMLTVLTLFILLARA